MARRPNFGFEKRQKEIKKEQKRLAKLEKKHGLKTPDAPAEDAGDAPPSIQQHETPE